MTGPKRPSTRRFNAGFNSILEIYDSNNSHFLRKERKKVLDGEIVSFSPVILAGLWSVLAAEAAQDAGWSLFKMCANDAH